LNLYYGARLEYQALRGENAAVTNANGEYVGRFANYYLGATAPDGTKIAPTSMSYDWLNYALTAAVTYKLTKEFGFTGDFTYITQHPKIENFAPATLPNTDKISVPLGRAGIYYNNEWLSLTSLFSYISKTNNNSTLNLQHKTAAGQTEIMAAPLNYDIKTLGWTTDVVARPFKGFDLHFLFTYQKPTYKKYETSVTFSDGYVGSINATGNIVAEIPEVIVEIDPSYMITKDLKIWTSFRYFSKTYANINDAYYFNGRWETFGGLNWQVNKKLALGCTVVNFLNQTGAKGSIAGAELIEKEKRLIDVSYEWGFNKNIMPMINNMLNTNHTIHDTRVTFASLCQLYKVDVYARKKILGHKLKDITFDIYTTASKNRLWTEVNKIKL